MCACILSWREFSGSACSALNSIWPYLPWCKAPSHLQRLSTISIILFQSRAQRFADTQTETHSAILTMSEVFALFFKVTKSSWAARWQSLFTSLLLSPSPFLFICLEATHQRGSVMDKEILRHRLAMREGTLLCAALYLKIYFCLPLFKPKCVDRVVFSCG